MNKHFIAITISLFFLTSSIAQSVIGKWKSVDDDSGKVVGIVNIYEEKGKIYGTVEEITLEADRNKRCTNCTGEDKNKPILGLTVIKGLVKDGDEYYGHILDPKYGKLYKCYIRLESPNKLKVRGYIGFSLLGRTQYWHRVKSMDN